MPSLFCDTSALVKWYVAEAQSDAVDTLLQRYTYVTISRLASLELHSALLRRQRLRQLTPDWVSEIFGLFQEHQRQGHIRVLPLTDQQCLLAEQLLGQLSNIPLRSLDALHLACARESGLAEFATADRTQAGAARSLGFIVFDFSMPA